MQRTLPLLLLLACTGDGTDTSVPDRDPYDVTVGPYSVDVRTTSYGIPHLIADDEGSLGYGLGYVAARDHICTIADQIVKTRSERSKYFGPGDNDRNIDSDFGWLHLQVRKQAEETWFDSSTAVQDRIVGYAAGYNQYLAEVGPAGLPTPCRGADWVQPITHIDLLAYYYSLGQWASGYNLVSVIGQAQPPNSDGQGNFEPVITPPDVSILEPLVEPPIGSNGWAIGGDESTTGRGALLSNTHFPMTGERQWHEFHMTLPGELDVYGVTLVGLPIPAMGFNKDVAWTHTVSNTPRFTAYLLKLTPGTPTSYLYDGEIVPMEATTYTIEVKGSGSLERTLYASQWGPIWNAPSVGWDGLKVMSYRDVNWRNTGLIKTFDGMGRATSLDAFKAAHRDFQGIPWVHTMAADKDGNAFYTDSAATPYLSDAAWDAYDEFATTNIFARQYAGNGLIVLDGSTSASEWSDDDRAARPGTVPFDDAPQLDRRDHVSNANQNHWMANANRPLTGFPRIYSWNNGTGTPRTTRTRMNNFYLQGRGENPERGVDGKWDVEEIESAALSFRSAVSELLKDDVVARCYAGAALTPEADFAAACPILESWDGLGGTDSVGAHIWREFLGSGPIMPGDLLDAGPLFAEGFDVSQPIDTPRGLAPAPAEGEDPVLAGLSIAVQNIQAAGFELDTPLGDIQIRKKGDATYATPGGNYFEGYIGIATWSGKSGDTTLLPGITRGRVINGTTDLTDEGYVITNGNSWVMAMQFTDDGPDARAVMVYSQSEDPDSPNFADQTALYAEQKMRPIRFSPADIEADPAFTSTTLTLDAQGD